MGDKNAQYKSVSLTQLRMALTLTSQNKGESERKWVAVGCCCHGDAGGIKVMMFHQSKFQVVRSQREGGVSTFSTITVPHLSFLVLSDYEEWYLSLHL